MDFNTLITAELQQHFFSGMQYHFASRGTVTASGHFGTCSFDDSEMINESTLFDLASLTKALCTVPVLYHFFEKEIISPDDRIALFFPELGRDIRIIDLLRHASGYPAYREFFRICPWEDDLLLRQRAVISTIAAIDEVSPPVYSDLNFLLLGFLIEKLYAAPLDEIWYAFLEEIHSDQQLCFAHPPLPPDHCAATMFSTVRNRVCHGEVEDENCFYLGSVSGHAGLFGSAESVSNYLQHLMREEWFLRWFRDLDGAGFDRPTGQPSNYGANAQPHYRGHLGFTGTAFLIDADAGKSGVFLTNRTHKNPDKENWKERMRRLRSAIFDNHF